MEQLAETYPFRTVQYCQPLLRIGFGGGSSVTCLGNDVDHASVFAPTLWPTVVDDSVCAAQIPVKEDEELSLQ